MTVPDQNHRDLAVDPARSVLLQAPAGSGKTAVLLLRYLRCLAVVEQPEQVLAISFTNKAAAEIRQRVIAALRQPPDGDADWEQALNRAVHAVLARDKQQNWRLLDHPGRMRIQTFDSFCISLAKRRPLLSGVGVLSPSADPSALYRDAALSLFSDLDNPAVDPEVADALAGLLSYASNRIEQLVPLLGNLLGKREQWMPGLLGGDTDAVAAVLARRLEARWQQMLDGLSQIDFSALSEALAGAAPEHEPLVWAAEPDFSHDYWRRLADFLLTGGQSAKRALRKKVDKRQGFGPKNPYKATVQEWLQAHQDSGIEQYLQVLAELPDPELPEEVAMLCERFRVALLQLLAHLRLQFERSGEMDFTEIGFAAISALRWGESGLEDAPGEALLAEDRIQHVLVDEMQDTSVNQIRLLTDLVSHWQADEGRSLFFCGDLMQSIYRFRGALVGLFNNLVNADQFAGQSFEKLRLSANFRSSAEVVDWVNRQFEPLISAGQGFVRAQPQKADSGLVSCHRVVQADDKQARRAEAKQALQLIQTFLVTEAEGDLAVLVRSRSHLTELIPLLRANDIAFSSQNIDRLSSSAPVQDYLALLRVLSHPADRLSWAVLLRAACVGMSWADVDVLMRAGANPAQAFDAECSVEGMPEGLSEDGQQRWLHLAQALNSVRNSRWSCHAPRAAQRAWHALRGHELLDDAQTVDIQRLQALIEEQAPQGMIRDYRALQSALDGLYATPQPARIHLMTIHGAKGLEFDWIISLGLNRQSATTRPELIDWLRLDDTVDAPTLLTPRSMPDSDEAVERLHRYVLNEQREAEQQESLRLLYVCVTRAVKQLHLIAGIEDEDSEPRNQSMAGLIWSAFQSQPVQEPEIDYTGSDELYTPLSPVIDNSELISVESAVERSGCDLEEADSDTAGDDFDENIRQRALGLVYHEWMQWWATALQRDACWVMPDAEARRQRLQARLRHHCLPEQDIEAVTADANLLIDKTVQCEHGRWLLQPRQQSGCEQVLLAHGAESLRRLIVDRWFVDASESGTCAWIIDYKTAGATTNVEDFLSAQAERYRHKMLEYRQGLVETAIADEVRCALYFPFYQRLMEIR